MEKKQNSIEWLVEQLNHNIEFIPLADWDKIRDIVQQAKKMHKEEVTDAYIECWMNDGGNGFHKVKEAEQYYNETFEK